MNDMILREIQFKQLQKGWSPMVENHFNLNKGDHIRIYREKEKIMAIVNLKYRNKNKISIRRIS